MSIVLHHQVEASQKSADELLLGVGQPGAMTCLEVQDQVRTLVNLLDSLDESVRSAQSAAAEDIATAGESRRSHWDGEFRNWFRLYQRLEQSFRSTSQLIGQMERAGCAVADKQRFTEAWLRLRAVSSFDYEQVLAAQEEVRQGKTRPLPEVWDELWNQPDPEGAR